MHHTQPYTHTHTHTHKVPSLEYTTQFKRKLTGTHYKQGFVAEENSTRGKNTAGFF